MKLHSVQNLLEKTQQPWWLLDSQGFLQTPLESGLILRLVVTYAVLGQQALSGGLVLFQELVTVDNAAVSLTWEEWDRLDPDQRDFCRESALKGCRNTVSLVSPSKC